MVCATTSHELAGIELPGITAIGSVPRT
jgi:hypothetical protein